MKIVFLQDDFPPESKGGAGNVVATLALALHKAGNQVTIITATQNQNSAGAGAWEGITVHRIYNDYHIRWRAWKSLNNKPVVREVERILMELKPDVVHAHNVHYYLSYASLGAAKRSGAKVFLTAHDTMLFAFGKVIGDTNLLAEFRRQKFRYNPFRNLVIRKYLQNISALFAVSKALKDALEKHGFAVAAVIYNGIDPSVWSVQKEEVASFVQKHALSNRPTLLFGGRISKAKGGDVLVEALPAIVAKVPNAALLLVGKETPYVAELKERAQHAGIDAAIASTGWITGQELKAAYSAADVLVAPSLYLDPLPTVVLEAAACGKPAVVSTQGGLPELVTDGQTGFVVDPKNAALLAEKIILLLTNKELAHTMGQAALVRVQETFTLEQQLGKLTHYYES